MIYTGYFDKLDDYTQIGLVPVCVAGYPPKGFKGVCYPILAPKKVWWQEWHDKNLSNDWYELKYRETVLDKLSPFQVRDDMQSFGKDIVMLCYEKPSAFCHRHLIAKWMNAYKIPVREYGL